MISIGIDVSKERSSVCVLKPYGEIICKPYTLNHTEPELEALAQQALNYDDEVKIVLEATGAYHLPVLSYLKQKGLFVSVINPLIMKKYVSMTLRKAKTDKLDALKIANYALDNWFKLKDYEATEQVYEELKLLGRQYAHYLQLRVGSKQALANLLDRTMPGIKTLLQNNSLCPTRDKLNDFVETYWHYDNITNKKEDEFVTEYNEWAKTRGYRQSEDKAKKLYAKASDAIPTLSSSTHSTKMLVLESVRVLREIDKTLRIILSQMEELAKGLKEYKLVRAMPGIGEALAPRLIAEVGDVRRFHSGKALIAYAGIDAPPYESGGFKGDNRRISKRGSSLLRKTGYEIMKSLKSNKPKDDVVYLYMLKKEREGKALKVAKIAALNKFLRIYYARVKELYSI